MEESKRNDLTEIIAQVLNEMKSEQGNSFSLEKVNLSELERRTGITRGKLRRIKDNGFVDKPHGLSGRKANATVLSGFTGILDELLRTGVTNSSVCMDRLKENGYTGGLTTVKEYISSHRDLVPAKRQQVAPQGNRGRRYSTDPGEAYQMDWGFVNVVSSDGKEYKIACFAMICHHCGERYIEFFPNAKQESLFIGMLHAFAYMGIPRYVLTDNMKSVVIGRDCEGKPVWQHDYEAFMRVVGFQTRLCKPRHPFTKGKVERLIRFVKDNFIPGRIFHEITDLNYEALRWCNTQNNYYHRAVDCIPEDKHRCCCLQNAGIVSETIEIVRYLCPERRISFDGFINYEGRRFGVPYSYPGRTCRIRRDGYVLHIYSSDLLHELTTHNVTWSRRDSFCEDQYASVQPEELPTMPVKVLMAQKEVIADDSFSRYNFDKEGIWDE